MLVLIEYFSLVVLAGALLWDLCLGELPDELHPVNWFSALARLLARACPQQSLLQLIIGGLITATSVGAIFCIATQLLLFVSLPVALVIGLLLLKASFVWRATNTVARDVHSALASDDLERARKLLSNLGVPNASSFDKDKIARVTVSVVADSTSSSFAAPVLFFLCFGIPGAIAYRTLHAVRISLTKNHARAEIGSLARIADDLANFLPSRLTALLFVAVGAVRGLAFQQAWRAMLKSRASVYATSAKWTIASMAGLLKVQLAEGLDDKMHPQPDLHTIIRACGIANHCKLAIAILAAGVCFFVL